MSTKEVHPEIMRLLPEHYQGEYYPFKDHVAKYTENPDGMRRIEWRNKSGGSIYFVRYIEFMGHLFICGDLGDAIFWASPTKPGFAYWALSGLEYLETKCVASEVGRRFKEWDAKKAVESLKWYVDQNEADHDEADETDLLTWKDAVDDNILDACESKEEYMRWMEDAGDIYFGSDWWELGEVGMVIHLRMRLVFAGLRAAWEQLGNDI